MSNAICKWKKLNEDAHVVCEEALKRIVAITPRDPFIDISSAYLQKGTETLAAVNVLYKYGHEEPAQALVRVLFELRINFDSFMRLIDEDMKRAIQLISDSMMLEKIKQARVSGFEYLPDDLRELLEKHEIEIASRYEQGELRQIRRYGFTGLSIEQRAAEVGHKEAYALVYRNFSRNVHSTDYLESYLKAGVFSIEHEEDYIESRDSIAQYVSHFCAVGMAEIANALFRLGLNTELDDLGKRQQVIKEDEKAGN